MSPTHHVFVVIVVCCVFQLIGAFPRKTRQSFFRCSGWGAGCTNMDYGSNSNKGDSPDTDSEQDEADTTKLSFSMPYLFTSGRSWGAIGKRSGAIGKRWGTTSWNSDPYLRRILLPYMLSATNNGWIQHYFPDEYLAFQQQFGRATMRAAKQKRQHSVIAHEA